MKKKVNVVPDPNWCCICGAMIEGRGHNPHPLVKAAGYRCCDKCNVKVLKARVEQYGVMIHEEGERK